MVHCNFVKGNHPCSAELTSQLECLAKVMHYSICFKVLKCQHLQTTSLTASIGEGGGESFAMVTALASHQCGLGSHPGVDTICGLSLLLFRSPATRGFFHPSTLVFPSPHKPHFEIPIDLERTDTNEVLRTPQCFGVKKKYVLRALVPSLF